jgi:serine/threonine protein kinase
VNAAVRLPSGYEFVRILGHGGSGSVVCARDVMLNRLVAVKVLIGGTLAAGGVDRLRREGRALAAVDSPRVVRVYAAVPMAEDLALVTELVEGPDLQRALGSGGLGPEDLLVILSDVADGLAACARRGVVHRDLKPANVLLTADGRAKVADFGLTRLSQVVGSFRSAPGTVSGTAGFRAPEQRSDPDAESAAGDAYSFAVLAVLTLGGRLPPAGLDGMPEPARTVLVDALSSDPARRPDPGTVMRSLRAVPLSAWGQPWAAMHRTAPVPVTDATETGEPGLSAEVSSPAETPRVQVSAPPPAPLGESDQPAAWVEVPVFRPVRPPWGTRLARPVGVVAGLLAALLFWELWLRR